MRGGGGGGYGFHHHSHCFCCAFPHTFSHVMSHASGFLSCSLCVHSYKVLCIFHAFPFGLIHLFLARPPKDSRPLSHAVPFCSSVCSLVYYIVCSGHGLYFFRVRYEFPLHSRFLSCYFSLMNSGFSHTFSPLAMI